jgi:hypothetical protein
MTGADLSALDADALLSAAEDNERVARAAEARRLEVAAAWADLHGALDGPARSAALPGAERLVRLGGDGTPEVAEFAPAELGAVLGVSPDSAAALVGDALELRHRLPRLWARVCAGEVRAWVARRIAQVCRLASGGAAAAVDRRVAPFAHSLCRGGSSGWPRRRSSPPTRRPPSGPPTSPGPGRASGCRTRPTTA